MGGGKDRCLYTGSGQLAAEPRCDCPWGREGKYCERRAGIQPRKPITNITAKKSKTGTDTKNIKQEVTKDESKNKKIERRRKKKPEDKEKNKSMSEKKDLSKTSSKMSYPEVITGRPIPVRAIHSDVMESELTQFHHLGEGLMA